MRSLFGVVCTLGLLLGSASAESGPHWLQVQSGHFTVITNGSERQARHIAGQFERMAAFFNKILPSSKTDTGSPIVVLALRDKRDFEALEPAPYLARKQLELSGLFLDAPDKSYILVRLDGESDQHPFAIVYHEYTHYILRNAPYLPLWLNEGLAEFYQNTDIGEKDVRYGQPSVGDLLLLRQSQLLPLPTLLAVDRNSPYYHEEDKGSIFYAETWALTHYLIVNDRLSGTNRLGDYMHRVAGQKDPVEAARNSFGDLGVLQKNLSSYIDHGDYRLFRMPTGFTADENAFHVEALATPDADAIRADVLADDDRPKEAQALIDEVLRSDPHNPLAHESEGLLRLRQHDLAGALQWYSEAVALHSTSYLAYYYVGSLSMQLGQGSDEAIRDSLEEALKLNPKFAPADDALAHFYGMRHEDLDRALLLSITAVAMEPANLGYRFNNAQLRMEQGNLDAALSVLTTARAYARNPGDLVQIDMRTEQIREYAAQLQRMKQQQAAAPSSSGAEGSSPFAEPSPASPRHTIEGVLSEVHCGSPAVFRLNLADGAGLELYAANFYRIRDAAGPVDLSAGAAACERFVGMKARVTYAEVSDPRVAGEVLSMEISR